MAVRAFITIQGLEAAQVLVTEAPDLPVEAMTPTLLRLRDIGVDRAKASLDETTGEKATGETKESIEGAVHEVRFPSEWELEIGTSLSHAKYVARTTGPVEMNRAVQIMPPLRRGYNPAARWRFIGVRPRIMKHPFLEESARTVTRELRGILGREIARASLRLDAKAKTLEGKIEGEIIV